MAGRTEKAGYLVVARGVVSLMALLIAMVLSRYLSQEDYATYRQTLLSYRFLAPFLSLGVPAAVLYFLPQNSGRARGVMIEALSILFMVGALFWMFLWCGGRVLLAQWYGNAALEETLLWFAPYALLVLPFLAMDSCLIAGNQAKRAAVLSILGQLTLGAIIILTVWISGSVLHAIQGLVLQGVIFFTIALWAISRATRRTSSLSSLQGRKTMLIYSIPLAVGSGLAYVNVNLDKFLVGRWVTRADYSVYVNGAMEVPFIGILTGSAASIILPDLVQSVKLGKYDEVVSLWRRAGVKTAAILFPVTCFLFVVAPDFLAFLFGEKYRGSAEVFRIYLWLVPIRISFFGIVFQAYGKSKLVMSRALLGVVVNVLLTLPMVHFFGAKGAAVATVITMVFVLFPYNLTKMVQITGAKWRDLYDWKGLKSALLSSVAVGSVVMLVQISLAGTQVWSGVKLVVLMSLGGLSCLAFHHFFGVWDSRRVCHVVWSKVKRALGK